MDQDVLKVVVSFIRHNGWFRENKGEFGVPGNGGP